MPYTCPVCGYDQMERPPAAWNICDCCGTEFEYDDATRSHEDLRREWIAAGAPWFNDALPPPQCWAASSQLQRAGWPEDAARLETTREGVVV